MQSPRIPPGGYVELEPTKNSTLSRVVQAREPRKFLGPRRTSDHQRFVGDPLCRNPAAPVL